MEEELKEIKEIIDKLEKRNAEIYEGFMATTNELCDITKELERLKVRDELLVENNTRLIHQKQQLEEVLDKVLDRTDKAIEYIEDRFYTNKETGEYCLTHTFDSGNIYKLLEILKGEDK